MAYSAGTAYLEVVPSFLNLESLLAKGARDIAKSLDKSLGAQLGKAMQGAAKEAEPSTARAGQALGKTFADNAVKNVQAAFAHIPETDRILKPLRKELEDISKIDLGQGFDEKDFIGRVERAYTALRKAQEDAQGKNAVGRYTNAGNAAASLGQVKDIVEAARKRGFMAGDAFSDAYLARLKAMDRALPDTLSRAGSGPEQRQLAAIKQRIQDAQKLKIGDTVTADNNPLNLKVGVKISGEDLKRELGVIEGQLDQFTERAGTLELVVAADKARQQAAGFVKDIQTQEEKANEDAAKAYLKDWDAAVAERERREKSARDQILKDWDAATAEGYKRDKAAREQAIKESIAAAQQEYDERKKLDEQNRRLRLQQTRREIDERARELRAAREQEYREQEKAAAEAQRAAQKATADLERERQRAAEAARQSFGQSTAGDVQQRAGKAADRIVDLPVHLQANNVDREMAEIRGRIKALGDIHIGVDVDAETFANRVKAEFDQLSKIAHDKKIDIEVRTDAARAATELGGILLLLNRIDHDKAEVKIDVDSALSNFATMASELNLSLGRLGGLIALGASIGTAIVPAAAAAAASIGAIGTAALGAGSGIGVMFLAFSGVGDAIKALGAYHDNLANSNVALKRSSTQLDGAVQQVRSAEMGLANTRRKNAQAAIKAQQSIKDAIQEQKDATVDVARANQDSVEKVASAQRDLTQAHRDDLDARLKLNEAYVQAKRALEDLNSQLRGNSLDQRQATLDIAKAKADLDKMLANPRATKAEREQADITYQQRLLQMDDLKRKGGQLQDEQDKRFKQGIGQSDEVKKAREDLSKADQRVLDGQRALTRAHQDQARTQIDGMRKLQKAQDKINDARQSAANQQKDAAYSEYTGVQSLLAARRALANATDRSSVAGGAQLSNLQTAMAKLSPTAQAFARYIYGMQDAFFALRKAADPVLAGLQTAMESFLGKTSKDAEKNLKPVFDFVHQVAVALGQAFIQFAGVLKSPELRKFFDYIAKTAAPTIQLLYQMFENVFVGIVNLFMAFTPLTDQVNNGLLGLTASFRKWSEGLGKNKGFQDFIGYMRKNGPLVAHLLGQMVTAIVDLIIAAAPVGTIVVQMFAQLFEWINKIPEKMLISIVAGIAAAAGVIGAFALATAALSLELPGLIALLVGGLIVAFSALMGSSSKVGDVLRSVWDGIKTGAVIAFGYLQQAIAALQPAFDAFIANGKAFWTGFLQPLFADIGTLFSSLWKALAPSFSSIGGFFKQVGQLALWLYLNVITPAWQGIMAVTKVLLQVLKPVFDVIGTVIGAVGTIVFWLLDKVFMPVIRGIVWLLTKILTPVIQFLWKFILKPILLTLGVLIQIAAAIIKVAIGIILIALKALGWMFKSVYDKYLKPAWDAIVEHVFKPMADWITKHIKPYWDKALDALGGKWKEFARGLGAIAKVVIHWVLNEGILKGYNWLADKFGISPANVHIPEPTGDWYTKSDLTPGKKGFARGGAVHGPGTRTSDSIVARLSTGEHVLTAAEVEAAGGHGAIYALREMLRDGFRMPGFAGGGAVNPDGKSSKMGFGDWLSSTAKNLGHKAKNLASSVADFLKDPIGNLKKLYEGMLAKVPNRAAQGVQSLLQIPKNLLDSVIDKVKGFIGLGGSAAAGGPMGNQTGAGGWAWQESILRAAFGDRVTFTSTTGGGHAKNSWHYKGHALDSVGPDMMAIFNWIKAHYGATSKELIYSPAGTGIKNGKPVDIRSFYGNSVYQNHFNHVHWAYDKGGLIPDTRKMPGGVMQVFHGRRTPDKVLTDNQWQHMAVLADQARESMASGNTYNFPYRDSTLNYDELNRWSARQDALARVNRRNY